MATRFKVALILLISAMAFACAEPSTSTTVNSDPSSGVVKGADEKKSDSTTTDSTSNKSNQ